MPQTDALPVMVEYEIFNVPSEALQELPERVTRAVRTLVRRQRVPSDEDIRDMLRDAETPSAGSDASEEPTRVRVMLPHSVAVELALHRSFQEGGNVEQRRALTAAEIRTLSRRSRFVHVRQLRSRRRDDDAESSRPLPERRRISPSVNTCIICMDRVRHRRDRVFLDPCAHVFHRECIVQWLEKLPRKCPSCRSDVNLSPLAPEPPMATRRMTTRSQTRRNREGAS